MGRLFYDVAELAAFYEQRVVALAKERLEEQTAQLKENIEIQYELFFDKILDEIVGTESPEGGGGIRATPSLIKNYMGKEGHWKPLSPAWAALKDELGSRSDFYIGLTNVKGGSSRNSLGRGQARASGSKGTMKGKWATRLGNDRKKPGKVSVPSFESYMNDLAGQGVTAMNRIFGPVGIEYTFSKDNQIVDIESFTTRTSRAAATQGQQVFANIKGTRITATVRAFTRLKGVQDFSEAYVVDYILKRLDPGHEKQWVKVNSNYGFGRGKRPVRAFVAPLISWYMNDAFAKIMRDFKL